MKSILDRSFQYTPAAQTDLRRTFKRIREEQKKRAAAAAEKQSAGNVRALKEAAR
jgi:plasmid stabilization system protein ParE